MDYRAGDPIISCSINANRNISAPPDHRIGVRQVDGIGEFYDRQTSLKLIPKVVHIRLADQRTPSGDCFIIPHSM
jgi:hypothetical protein